MLYSLRSEYDYLSYKTKGFIKFRYIICKSKIVLDFWCESAIMYITMKERITMKDIILKEVKESETQFLHAMQDEQGREWIRTIVKNPNNKEEMWFQTPFLIPGKAVPCLIEIERQLKVK